MNFRKLTIFFLLISVALFIASLTQKCYCLGNECADSITAFLFGWLGVLFEFGDVATYLQQKFQGRDALFNYKIGATLSWFANPLLIISFVTLKLRPKITILTSSLSTLLILSFLVFKYVIANEAGHYYQINEYKIGYYLWLTSSLTLLTGSIYLTIMSTGNEQKNAL